MKFDTKEEKGNFHVKVATKDTPKTRFLKVNH